MKIRKYKSNRKMYDIEKKEYVNLDKIKDAIRNDIPVEILTCENQDITKEILVRVLATCYNVENADLLHLIRG